MEASQIAIEDLQLGPRPRNSLRRHNVRTVGQLLQMQPERLANLQQLGVASLCQLELSLDRWTTGLVSLGYQECACGDAPIAVLRLSGDVAQRLASHGILLVDGVRRTPTERLREALGAKLALAVKVKAAAYRLLAVVEGGIQPPPRSPGGGGESRAHADGSLAAETMPAWTWGVDLSSLELSTRAYNALRRAGIRKLGALLAMTREEIMHIRNIGPKASVEIEQLLHEWAEAARRDGEAAPATTSPGQAIDGLVLDELTKHRLRRCGVIGVNQLASLSWERLVADFGMAWQDVEAIDGALSRIGRTLAKEGVLYPLGDSELVQLAEEKGAPLDRISVRRLALTDDIKAVLRSAGIGTVGELCQASQVVLNAQVGHDVGTVDQLPQRLSRYLSWIAEQESWDGEITEQDISPIYQIELAGTPLDEVLAELLACLGSDRDRHIVMLRMGLADGEPKTLQEIGDAIGMTRERVRQLELRAMKRLRKQCGNVKTGLLLGHIRDSLDRAGGVASTRYLAEAVQRAAKSVTADLPSAVRFLCAVDPEVRRVRRDVWGLESFPLDEAAMIGGMVHRILRENHGFASREHLFGDLKATAVYQALNWRVTDEFLVAYIGSDTGIKLMPEGDYVLAKRTATQLYAIAQALRRSGKPLHYSDIAQEADYFLPNGQSISPHTVHVQLGRVPDLFVRCGHGVFGLCEWGLQQDRSLAEAVYRVLAEAARPLHVERITDQVLRTWRVGRGSVNMALQTDERFYRLGNGIYWLRDLVREGTDEGKGVPSFSDLYGGFLLEGQERLEAWAEHESVDARDEVEKIRRLGSGLFE